MHTVLNNDEAIARIAEMQYHFERLWVLTQNVDGLHKAAGARHVIDIHGDLHHLLCMRCPYRCTVEINPDVGRITHLVDIKLAMRATPALDAIWQRYLESKKR